MRDTLPVRVRLGVFEVDLRAGELRDGDRTVRLQEQSFQILLMLIAAGGEVVTREEIRSKLWPNDTIVEFDHSINAAIKKLRQALGDSAEEPKYVETIARRGYRLLVPVQRLGSDDSSGTEILAAMPVRLPSGGTDLIGRQVSHYRVLEVIGGGGMGMVYKAEDLKLGREVALKFLPEEMAWDAVALQRFEREARAASSLDHPNICTIHEVEEHDEQPFIVMQLLQGQTLRDRLSAVAASGEKLPLDELLDVGIQICDGLLAAHEKGIIHRDIKPANIFLTGAGQVKILDFGLAKLVSVGREMGSDGLQLETGGAAAAPQPAKSAVDTTLTRLGVAMGTAGYMSPEQVRGEKLDARTDIFSFGLVLYEMGTGRRAFSGETAAIVLDAIVNNTPVPVRELRPELSAELEAVINKAREKDREKRYQSAAELRNELRVLKSDSEQSKRRWSLWLATAVMLLLAAAAVAWFGWHRAERPKELTERQLTANPVEDSVNAAAISPDGKYVAYQDQTGFYLRSIETGETHPITLPAEMRNRIYHLCWFPGGEEVLADVEGPNASFDTWVITILGGAKLRQLYRHALATGISPDGGMIAFTTGEFGRPWKELWVGGIKGEAPRKLVTAGEQEQLFSPVWSPDGRWIAYGRTWETAQGSWSAAIEVRPAGGGPPKTLVAESGLSESNTLSLAANPWFVGAWSPDWRLLFTVAQDLGSQAARTKYSLWDIHVDPRTNEAVGKPEQLTQWSDFAPRNLTITSDGKRLSLLNERHWLDVYLSDISPDGTFMKEPRRFTLDNRGSNARAWMPNSETILFDSQRNGKWEIFGQMVHESIAHAVIASPGDVYGGVVSPDGSWFLYWQSSSQDGILLPTSAASSASVRLMRRPVAGGPPQMVLEAPFDEHRHIFSCSSNPKAGSPCVLGLIEGKDLVFYSVDPLQGKGKKLGEIEVFGAYEDWGLSPDGSRVALVDADKYEGRIEILTLADGSWHELAVEPKGEHLQSIAWAANGKSFFATTYAPDSYNLLHITLGGIAQTLLHNDGRQWLVSPLPSPDGKYLAFDAQTWDSNVWMIDNF